MFNLYTILMFFHSEFAGLQETAKNLGLGECIDVQINRCVIVYILNKKCSISVRGLYDEGCMFQNVHMIFHIQKYIFAI